MLVSRAFQILDPDRLFIELVVSWETINHMVDFLFLDEATRNLIYKICSTSDPLVISQW
jgi:hypothetical protein